MCWALLNMTLPRPLPVPIRYPDSSEEPAELASAVASDMVPVAAAIGP